MTSTYKEWIKFGRDPVYPKDFYALSRREAKAFFQRFMEAIPERMRQLELLIHERRPRANWRPDYSDEAFRIVVDVLTEAVEKVPRTKEEIDEIRGGRSEIMNVINEPIWQWKVTDRTISIAYDSAIYFGNDLIDKESRMAWQFDEGKVMTKHQPVIRAPIREEPDLDCAPLDMFRLYTFRVANNDPHVRTLIENRRYWLQDVAAYKRNNPSTEP